MIAIISILMNRCISKFNQRDTKLVIKNIACSFSKKRYVHTFERY